jgi:hypothetical protein
MHRRVLVSATLTTAAALAFALAPPAAVRLAAQAALGTTAAAAAGRAASTPARTPWGDPDIGGVWSSDDMRGIPRERPEEFGTRRWLTDEEFARRVARDEQTRRQEANRVGAFRNDVGTRTFRQTSLVVDPPDGRIPPLTAEGARRRDARNRGSFGEGPFNTFEDFTLYDRCITRGVVGSLGPAIYGNGVTIVQSPGQVAISYEMVHDTRIIPLDGRPHLGPAMRQYMGNARGRWEGDALVIGTTGFTGRTAISGVPHSEALRLTERISRVDELTLDYEVTIDDPHTYTRPWTMVLQLTQPPGFQQFPYECHEGNLGLRNILSAERAEDRALEDDLKKGLVRPRRPVQNAGGADQ